MFDSIRGDLYDSPHRSEFVGAEDYPPLPIRVSTSALSAQGAVAPIPNDYLWLTDDLLFNYQRCSRRAFLDLYGEPVKRDAPSDYLLKLRQDSVEHQFTILGELSVHQPHYPRHDWVAGSAATEALMRQGVERINRGVLITPYQDGVYLVSCPKLLVKQPGTSCFGDWIYVPMEIKLGKRPKLDYQIISTFHTYVLATVQQSWPDASWLILRERDPYAVNWQDLLPRMEEILQDCIQMLVEQQEPEVFISHNRCDLCHWYGHCYQLAQADEHLSLLPGVTPSRYIHLEKLQLTTVEKLAAAKPKQLESLPGFGSLVAHKLVQQAQSVLEQRAIARFQPQDASGMLLTPQELPTAPVELYFDIEASPDQNLIYLHGVLVVDREAQTETFHALVAEQADAEFTIWQQFLDLVWRYPTAPIFHFCPYEVQTVRRLANDYATPDDRIEPLLKRFVDLHERITRTATLPVESYALKPIARWLGFDWRDREANGAQSIYWYAQWLSTGDRTFLDAILRYNEDDCRATYRVKDWLVEFTQQT